MSGKETIAPLRRDARYAGFFAIFWLWASGNVLLTNFISGSSYALGLGFWPMLVITVTGFLLGLAVCSWSSQRSARYGIDEMVSLRPAFGVRGSNYGVIMLVGINFGWVGILASLAGTAIHQVLAATGGAGDFPGAYSLYALGVGILLPLVIVMISQKAAFVVSKIAVPLLLVFVAYIVVRLVTDGHLARISGAAGDGSADWAGAFEIIFAFCISWLPYLGAWNRFAKTERASFWGTYLGLAATGILFAVVGGMATLATGEVDPAVWSAQLDLGIVAVLTIVLGTVAAVTNLLGSGSIGIISAFPRLNYRWVCAAVTLPSIIFVYASTLQGLFDTLLIFVGLLAGPYWAVALADYFVLRRQRIDVVGCYDEAGPYRYWRGFNPVAFGCAAAGMLVWIVLGGWTSGIPAVSFSVGESLFGYVTATLPSMLTAGVLYLVAAPRMLPRRGWGGYGEPTVTAGLVTVGSPTP